MSSVILLREFFDSRVKKPFTKWQGRFGDERAWRRCHYHNGMVVLPLANGGWVDVTSKVLGAQRAGTN